MDRRIFLQSVAAGVIPVVVRAGRGVGPRADRPVRADDVGEARSPVGASPADAPRKVDDVARAQGIPVSFLENILTQLRSTGLVQGKLSSWFCGSLLWLRNNNASSSPRT